MKTAAVSEVKARLSEYLSHVKAGAEVVITDRGKPVARIVPVGPTQLGREVLARMEKSGLVKIGTGQLPVGFWKLRRARDPEGAVRKALMEEREGGR